MAQYWLEIASSADLDKFTLTAGGTLAYELDGTVPSITLASASTYGEYVRWLDVPSVDDAVVSIYCRMTGDFASRSTGPAVRINSQNAYAVGYRGNASALRRIYLSTSSSTTNLTVENSTDSAANGNVYAWREMLVSGTTLELRDWLDGNERPASAEHSVTDATYSAGFVGFGRPATTFGAKIYVSIISVGTDGDPAPTGPVGGERQRSRLILTPW